MRISGGAVSIADITDRTARNLGFVHPFWLNEIRNGRAFGIAAQVGGVAGEYSHLQIMNPVASGVTILIRRCQVCSVSGGGLEAYMYDTPLTNLNSTCLNLLRGAANSVGQLRNQSNAAQLGTLYKRIRTLADDTYDIMAEWDVELGAGEGVLVVPSDVNKQLSATFEFVEL